MSLRDGKVIASSHIYWSSLATSNIIIMIKLCGILVSLTNDVKTANFGKTGLQRTVIGEGEKYRWSMPCDDQHHRRLEVQTETSLHKTNPSHTLYPPTL